MFFLCVLLYLYLFLLALTVYSRSPSADEALRGFQLLQLPGTRTLKGFIHSNLEQPGSIQCRLKSCHEEYDRMVEAQREV